MSKKRKLFDELISGIDSMKQARENKLSLRMRESHLKTDLSNNSKDSKGNPTETE